MPPSKLFPVFVFASILAVSNAYFLNKEQCLNYTVYPVQYELTIIPYVYKDRNMSFMDCEIRITVIANAPNIQVIELDARDIEIANSVRVLFEDRDLVQKNRPYEYDKKAGKLMIYLKEPLIQYSVDRTTYIIVISFRKIIGKDSHGVFIVPYEDGGTKYVISTRLSPDKAKYFFPCFDNPRFEAVFKFRVYIMPDRAGTQRCNTSLVIAKEQRRHNARDNYEIIEYIPSPQVGLHQVGFHYSQFGSKQVSADKTNDTIVLWAPNNKLQYYDYILRFGENMLNLIHEYASVNRPLVYGPINIVAIPNYLEGYEVGSWNLLTNGEHRLAFVPQFTSIQQTELMKFELTQQLSRIWLGNPGETNRTRWNEEWFKEGFATYLAYYWLSQDQHGVQTMKQRWPIDAYGLQMKHKSMVEDWHHSTPALTTFNNTLAVQIPPRYKDLVKYKTASLLWMIEDWIGSKKFHVMMVKYINTRRGLFVTLKDFMEYINEETVECRNQFFNESTASRVLESWFHQPGYPVVEVNVLRDRKPNAIQLKQHKFSFTRESRRESRFLIPISYVVQKNENCFNCYQPRFTIDQTYTFEENLNDGWILLNRNASGYYRVNYDTYTWKLIAKSLIEDKDSIGELNRAQIVNDAFALYASGEIDQSLAVEILDNLDNETSPIVWDAAIAGFELLKIDRIACNMTSYLYKDWQEFMRSKVKVIYKRLVDDYDKAISSRTFRSSILTFACDIGYRPCVNKMRFMYDRYMKGTHRMPPRHQCTDDAERTLILYRLDPDSRGACFKIQYESDSSFGAQGFNTFEYDDKLSVEHKVRKERQFVYKLPVGIKTLDRLTMSTTILPSTESTLHLHSTDTTTTEKQPVGSSSTVFGSPILLILAASVRRLISNN